ncbi:IS66 family insertion sequence element accessory protein TnpB [Petrocella sp. FN5]|uniref:IS66 family insertion sequence element accessory protein TnpB n=1 Tax=Petrocella sp. FN5 TaxID=3032002 RepID=UPI003FA71155
MLYKRINTGGFCWPRTTEEALEISEDQYQQLMQGFEILPRRPIHEVPPPQSLL